MATEDINIEPYKRLSVYADAGAIPLDAVATQLAVAKNAVIAYIGAAKRSTKVYEQLRSAGYADSALPAWFKRPAAAPAPTPPAPPSAGAGGANERLPEAPEKQGEPQGGAKESQPPQEKLPPGEEVPATALRNIMSRGQARHTDLEKRGILQRSDGTYVRGEVGSDGKVRYVPVPDSELQKLAAGDDTGVAISQALTQELDIHYQSIARKVALNPTIFTYYSYMMGKGEFEGDMGDFLNFCVKFTMIDRS